MSFKFEKSDKITDLHPNLKKHFGLFMSRRVAEVDDFSNAVNNSDFAYLRDYCHKIIGISASYNCYRLDEITRYIQIYARSEDIKPIQDVKDLFLNLLDELQQVSNDLI